MTKSILVCAAHPDDEIFGIGGTIAAYVKKKYTVTVLIFSYGEKGNVWLKKTETKKIRKNESTEAARIVGTQSLQFLGLTEGNFEKEAEEHALKKLTNILKRNNFEKIFTHAPDDPHPDHAATARIVLTLAESMRKHYDVYSFDIWTPINIKKRKLPRLYVDITETFRLKTAALKCFRSQKSSLIALLWSVYVRAIKAGFENKTRFAEVFYKIH